MNTYNIKCILDEKGDEREEMRQPLLMENKHRWPPQLLRTPDVSDVRSMASYSWAIE